MWRMDVSVARPTADLGYGGPLGTEDLAHHRPYRKIVMDNP
mgnify:CR=1 FL=1